MIQRVREAIAIAPWWWNAIGALVFGMGVISVVLMYLNVTKWTDYIACDSRWQTEWVQGQEIRAAAADTDRATDRREAQAMSNLVQGIIDADGNRAAVRQAFEAWQQEQMQLRIDRADAAAQRAANPLPEPPAVVCGNPNGD